MSIREWYGFKGEYDKTSDINSCVDGLLTLYAEAIKQYFSLNEATSYRSILTVDQSKLNLGQKLFLEWLNEKGFPYLNELSSKPLPNNEQLVSKIEYDKYILEEEMDFQFPDDVRASLISIVNDVPEYIQAASEVSVSIDVGQIWKNWSAWLPEKHNSNLQKIYFYNVKDFDYPVSNYSESASNAGSLFMFRGIKTNGNFRILQIHSK
jgi:hypothetical protein